MSGCYCTCGKMKLIQKIDAECVPEHCVLPRKRDADCITAGCARNLDDDDAFATLLISSSSPIAFHINSLVFISVVVRGRYGAKRTCAWTHNKGLVRKVDV